MTRNKRQKIIEDKLFDNPFSTFIAVPGFGKTKVCLDLIKRIKDTELKDNKVIVVVPTIRLKEQWELQLSEIDIEYLVLTINKAREEGFNASCALAIFDEFHNFASDVNINAYNNINAKRIVNISGTPHREDGKEELILDQMPIVDEVTPKEALNNGWINKTVIYNVMIETDLTEYHKHNEAFEKYFHLANYDLQTLFSLSKVRFKKKKSKEDILNQRMLENKSKKAMLSENQKIYKEIQAKKNVNRNNWLLNKRWQEKTFDYYKCINACLSAFKARKEFSTRHPIKFQYANLIIDKYDDIKTITFSSEKKDLSKITGTSYHSDLADKTKESRTEKFRSGKIRVLNTINAMNEGIDIPDLHFGIITSGYGSKTKFKQRRGRIERKGEEHSVLIQLIIKGTQDEIWAKKAQEGCDVIKCNIHDLLE